MSNHWTYTNSTRFLVLSDTDTDTDSHGIVGNVGNCSTANKTPVSTQNFQDVTNFSRC